MFINLVNKPEIPPLTIDTESKIDPYRDMLKDEYIHELVYKTQK